MINQVPQVAMLWVVAASAVPPSETEGIVMRDVLLLWSLLLLFPLLNNISLSLSIYLPLSIYS